MHILNGDSGFTRYYIERPFDLPTGLPASYRFIAGSSFGGAAIYGLDLRRPRHRVLDLFSLSFG